MSAATSRSAAMISHQQLVTALAAFCLLAVAAPASGQWVVCDNTNSIKGGSCNSASRPCEPRSGCTNAGKVTDIETCEGLCEKAPGCVAAVWHDSTVRGWAQVCILQNQTAWHPSAQSGHHAACLKSDSFPACKCGSAPPSPPPPGPTGSVSCIAAKTAYAKAQQALGGRGATAVWDSLDAWMQLSKCPNATRADRHAEALAQRVAPQGFRDAASWSAASAVFFVSPGGSDSAAGTQQAPFQTLPRAQRAVRDVPVSRRAGTVVNLLAGTYHLNGTLVFTAADNGAGAGKPVTWQAYPAGAAVAISGGQRVECPAWTTASMNGITVHKCAGLPRDVTASASLFVNGIRQVRARYPDGDPLVPKDGYSSGAKARSYWPVTPQPFPMNMEVLATNGSLVATGSVPGVGGNVTVVDRSSPRHVVTQPQAYHGSRFNETFNYPYWSTNSLNALTVPQEWSKCTWREPVGAVVKMFHPSAWGSWAFEVAEYEPSSGLMSFSKGGFQEARGGTGVGDLYIENLKEELTAENEFFFDTAEGALYYVAEAGVDMASAVVEVVGAPRVLQFRGSVAEPVQHISFVGVNISRSAPTYLESYEVPSGGDWSIHRGGAVFMDGAVDITLDRVRFDQVGGNGVFLSNYARNNTVKDCDFWRTGDTAVAAVGSGMMMNGSAPTFPAFNTIAGNHMDTVGVYMKQTSCYFKAITYHNNISNNICHDGPRAGVNFNDGFMGADTLSENVIWAMVRETGDHGTFNSWDRREWFYPCPEDTSSYCFMPKTHQVSGNMFIGPAGWNMDHDDGSSEYHDYNNIIYQGGFKYRDGINRNMTGNLMLQSKPVFQVTGFETDYFNNNYLVGPTSVCAPPNIGGLSGNTFISITKTQLLPGSVPGRVCDNGTRVNMTVAQVEQLARSRVGLPLQ